MSATYAAYRGDEFIDLGTKRELAESLGVSEKSIELYMSPSYRRRPGYGKRLIVIRIED